jgi:hypothetical protein
MIRQFGKEKGFRQLSGFVILLIAGFIILASFWRQSGQLAFSSTTTSLLRLREAANDLNPKVGSRTTCPFPNSQYHPQRFTRTPCMGNR